MKRFLLPALFAIITIAACKKEKKEAKIDGYKFKNDLNESVHAVLYGSAVDYINQVNPVWEGDIAAKSTKTVTDEYLTENDSCYIDWHTPSHSRSNWISGHRVQDIYTNGIMFFTNKSKPYKITDEYDAQGNPYALLLKNGKGSKWKVFNAYTSGGSNPESVWDKMDQYQKQMNMTVTFKSITITYPEATTSNVKEYNILGCRLSGSNAADVFGIANAEMDIFIYNISKPYNSFDWYHSGYIDEPLISASTDTLLIHNRYNNVAYAIVRQ